VSSTVAPSCPPISEEETFAFEQVDLPALTYDPVFGNYNGGAVVVEDFDLDGWDDVFLGGREDSVLVINDRNGGFVDAALPFTWADFGEVRGASSADFDGDGDHDIFLATNGVDYLLINPLGDETPVWTSQVLDPEWEYISVGGAWADINGDGYLDLAVPAYGPDIEGTGGNVTHFDGHPNAIFINNTDGTFTRRPLPISQVTDNGHTFLLSFQHLNSDHHPDLMLLNDFGHSVGQAALMNVDGNELVPMGVHPLYTSSLDAMGLAAGDVNGDGILDFSVSSFTRQAFYVSESGLWIDFAALYGIQPELDHREQHFGWGTELVDLDLDGDLDLAVAFGDWWSSPRGTGRSADGLWMNRGSHWSDEASYRNFGSLASSRGLALGDFNNDGRPDIVIRNLDEPSRVQLTPCREGTFARFSLVGPPTNSNAVGARVTVYAGDRSWFRDVYAGSTSLFSSSSPDLFFGLAGHTNLDVVEVMWPDGLRDRFENVSANSLIEIRHPDAVE